MEAQAITEMSENVEEPRSSSNTSAQKASLKRTGETIPLEAHLEILQLAAHDYQKFGGKIEPVKLDKIQGIALVLEGVDLVDGKLVLLHGTSTSA